MKNKLLQITFWVLLGSCVLYSCKNNAETITNLKKSYNVDSLNSVKQNLETKIDTCIAKNDFDSIYFYSLGFKKACITNDTTWAKKYIDIYNALDTAKKEVKIALLDSIIKNGESKITNLVYEIQLVKAISYLAYENENNTALYVKILEKTLNYKQALDSLGIGYKIFIYHNIGESYTKLNDNKSGLQYLKLYYSNCIKIKEDGKRKTELCKAAITIGNTYRTMRMYDSAEYYCNIATKIEEIEDEKKALSYAELAEVYNDLGNTIKAEETDSLACGHTVCKKCWLEFISQKVNRKLEYISN